MAAAAATHNAVSTRPPAAKRGLALAGLVLLTLLALSYLLGAVNDLRAASGKEVAADHAATFTALAGTSFAQTQASIPGVARYLTLLERGYALHEVTFALLFLVLVLIPFRQRRMWAWWAAWIPMIANLGYTFSFGLHDPTTLARALVTDIALPVLLLAHLPAFRARARTGLGWSGQAVAGMVQDSE